MSTTVGDYITFANNVVHSNAWYSVYANSGISILTPVHLDDSTDYKIKILNYVGGTGIHAYRSAIVDIVNNTAYLNSRRPRRGSVAGDTGRWRSQISDDFDGKKRPTGSGFDRGAFELLGQH